MRLAYGAVQRRGTLDHLIERSPSARRDASTRRVLAALRLGLYELLYLRGAPDYAVVADAVELAKAQRTRAVTASSTPCCAAPRARAPARCSMRSPTTRPSTRRIKHSHPRVDRAAVVAGARPRAAPAR